MTSVALPLGRSKAALPLLARIDSLGWPSAILVSLFGAAIRLHQLSGQSFWGDEVAAVELAKAPLRLLWSGWMVRETNPPLYYSLLHVWMGLFGQSELAVRSLSVLFGTGAILLIYALGRQVASNRAALIAAVLSALWVHQIHYSQEARGYILGACGALLAVIGLCRISDDAAADVPDRLQPSLVWAWVFYVSGALIALYTHTTHVLLPLLANIYFAWLWLFRTPRRWSAAAAWIGLNALIVVVWMWWGLITWKQLHLAQTNVSWIAKPDLKNGHGAVLTAYGPAADSHAKSVALALLRVVGGSAVLTAGVFGVTRLKLERGVMLAMFGIGAPVLLFLISQKTPIMLPRTFLWAQFAPILALASAIAAIRRPALRLGVMALAAVVLAAGCAFQPPKEPWREITLELKRAVRPGDVVLVSSVGAGVYLQHYCDLIDCGAPIVDVLEPNDGQNRWAQGLFRGPEIRPAQMGELSRHSATIWAVSRWADDPRPYVASVAQSAPAPLHLPAREDITVTAWRNENLR